MVHNLLSWVRIKENDYLLRQRVTWIDFAEKTRFTHHAWEKGWIEMKFVFSKENLNNTNKKTTKQVSEQKRHLCTQKT